MANDLRVEKATGNAPMQDLTSFSRIVEMIYDSTIDPSRWPSALEEICTFVQGCGANIFHQRIPDNATTLFHSWGEDENYRNSYIDYYWKLNPLFPASSFLKVGVVHQVKDVMPMAEFCASRLYQEWVAPQGILDALYVNLERSTTGAAAMAVRRRASDGLFDETAKARLTLVVPHVRRAVAIGNLLETHASHHSAVSATLDRLNAAVLLVASDGRLLHVNGPGRDMLTRETPLSASRGRLVAVDPHANEELRDALARAARGDQDLGTKGIAMSLSTGDTDNQIAHVLSLASGTRRGSLGDSAVAAIFVYDSAFPSPWPLEAVAQLYTLTAGELRVLAAAAQASGIPAIARSLGIAEATVKTHLQRLFAKTGARRQADLIKVLARHANPLRP